MNKKILLISAVFIVVLGTVFFFMGRTSKPEPIPDAPEQPLTVDFLQKEVQLIYKEIWRDEISQQETEERLILLENKTAELIKQHNLQAEINEFIARHKAVEELTQLVEPQITNIKLKLAAVTENNAESASPLLEKLSEIESAIYAGQISQEEVAEKFIALENNITEMIVQHNIGAEVEDFMTRIENIKELMQWVEPQITDLELQLGGIAEYFAEKYRTDTITEVRRVRGWQEELVDLYNDIWEEKAGREEINEKLSDLETKKDEMIARHNIKTEVDEYVRKIETATERTDAISQRTNNVQLQLHGLELYLSE